MDVEEGIVKSPILVMKFGGTSVGGVDAINQSVEIVSSTLEEWPRTVVVLSALSGVTNLLLEGAARAIAGDVAAALETSEQLRSTHHNTAEGLLEDASDVAEFNQHCDILIDEFSNLCGAIAILGEATPRALDAVASLGERLSIRLFRLALKRKGVPAQDIESTRLILTDSQFQAAHPDWDATRRQSQEVLVPLLNQGVVPVVTGFLGANPEGVITTLGRGGSDYSAAILAAAIRAAEVWIWTDVDGVMTADPRIVKGARTIPNISYLELAELAYFGAKVLHPKTVRPVLDAGIQLSIRNTFNPDHSGTRLLPRFEKKDEGGVKAVTAVRGQSLITIEGSGMLGVPGVAARAFGAVAATGTNVILISQASSEQSISFAVPLSAADQVVTALEGTFEVELANREIDKIWATGDVVIVTVVGSGMRHTPGVAGRVFSGLGAENVNVIAIAQGSSEVAISMVVDGPDMELAVRTLHNLAK
jgi:aspartate kinase